MTGYIVAILVLLGHASTAYAQDLPPGLLEPCKQKKDRTDALTQALQGDAEIPPECKAAIEKTRKVCGTEPSEEGIPDSPDGGGTHKPARVNAEAAGFARDKYNTHKKECDEALRPGDETCGTATKKLNDEWRAEQDPAKKDRLLKQATATRALREAARKFADTAMKCSDGYARIYDNAAQQAENVADLASERPPNNLTGDPLADKAAKTAAKDAIKETVKQAIGKEAAKLIPGGSAALELAEGNPAGAAKELAKEAIGGGPVTKTAIKATELVLAPSPVSVCSQVYYGPVAAYQAGCGYNAQSVNNAISILDK